MKLIMPHMRLIFTRRRVFVAVLLACCVALFLPGTSEAHAILLRSDPAQNAVLNVPPNQVHLWFSEALNPAFSTAVVVNAGSQRVDNQDAQLSPDNVREMDVTLHPNLNSGVYTVVWRADSSDDGHVLSGSFHFTVANPDGTIPTLSPGANALGNSSPIGLYTGQLDGPTLFNLVVITLVELGAVFWVGAQFWILFVLQPSTKDHEELRESNQRAQQRFERRFSFLLLLVLLLANIGVLLGQALDITGGNVAAAFAPTILGTLITSGGFGIYWLMRMIVLILAMRVALYQLRLYRSRRAASTGRAHTLLPWANLILGLALFVAIAMSSHAAAVSATIAPYAIMVDWLHLLAAAIWVGGMLYVATSFLPLLRAHSVLQQALSLITVLPYYTPWAITGVVILAVTGPFSAAVHLTSWGQLLTTAYGRALVVKIALVGALLLTSAMHVFLLRPRLKRAYQKYAYVAGRLQAHRASTQAGSPIVSFAGQVHLLDEQQWREISHTQPPSTLAAPESGRKAAMLAQQVKWREKQLIRQTQRLMRVLRWEPLLGAAVLVCVGLMNVFAGTLSPIAAVQQQQPATGTSGSFHTSVETSDNTFTVTLNINPDSDGPNRFMVSVANTSTGAPATNLSVTLSLSSLDMDMGIETARLRPDGKGHFSAIGTFLMGGNWQVRIQIRTPDGKHHQALVKVLVAY